MGLCQKSGTMGHGPIKFVIFVLNPSRILGISGMHIIDPCPMFAPKTT